MPANTYRILACIIPLQLVAMLAWTVYATRSPAPPAPTQQADHIVISKSRHTLTLLSHGAVLRIYPVALGRSSGPKQQQGDHRTPEGEYFIDGRNPHSRFHLALHLSYPNPADRARAAALHQPPGGGIEIHGLPPAFALLGPLQHHLDWTDGCIALSNSQVEEVYGLTPDHLLVTIHP